jgi:outer membrane protein assembly factor BamB
MAPRVTGGPTLRRSKLGRWLALGLGIPLALGLPIASAVAQSSEPGGWPQFQGDAAHAGFRSDGPQPPYAPRWTARPDAASGQRLSSPVAAAGVVLFTGPDALYAVDAATGRDLWKVARDGPPATPAVARVGGADLVVYTDGRDADTSVVAAVDLRTGRPAWDSKPSLKDESRSGVTVEGDRAFVADESGNVYAIGLSDATIDWTGSTDGTVDGPLAAADGAVYAVVGSSQGSRAATVDAFATDTGERRWQVSPDPTATFGSLPAVLDGRVVVALPDGSVLGLSTADGSQAWSVRVAALVSPFVAATLADGSAFVLDSTGGVHRLTPGSGRDWLFEFNEPALRTSPVVAGGDVLVGFEDGSIGAVDLTSGHMVFRSGGSPAPVTGIALAGDSAVVVRSGVGRPQVVAFEANPSGTLLDVVSPTVPKAAPIAVGFALAVLLGAAVHVPGRLLARRVGIRDPSADEDSDVAPAEASS